MPVPSQLFWSFTHIFSFSYLYHFVLHGNVDKFGNKTLKKVCSTLVECFVEKRLKSHPWKKEFLNVIQNIFGEENMEIFKNEYAMEYSELQCAFESTKRSIADNIEKVYIQIPINAKKFNLKENFDKML